MLFLLVGASVGIAGHQVLLALLGLGVVPAVANTVQAVLTLQLNFVGNALLTWRDRVTRSGRPLRSRWLRFQVARLSSLLLSVAAFPLLAPVIGTSPAYWSLLAAGAVVNFCPDRYWSFRHGRGRPRRPPPACPGRPTRAGSCSLSPPRPRAPSRWPSWNWTSSSSRSPSR